MPRNLRVLGIAAFVVILATPALAQDRWKDGVTFLAGGAAAFAIHESGHLVADEAFDAEPHLEAVHYGPFPFFAISPTRPLSGRRLYVVATAGFWTQMLTTEFLERRRDLRDKHAPFKKGMLAFDVLTSVGYSVAAFTRTGPIQRDTRGMADGARIAEPVAGAMVLAPAALAAYQYFRPASRWAQWATRAAALTTVAMVSRR